MAALPRVGSQLPYVSGDECIDQLARLPVATQRRRIRPRRSQVAEPQRVPVRFEEPSEAVPDADGSHSCGRRRARPTGQQTEERRGGDAGARLDHLEAGSAHVDCCERPGVIARGRVDEPVEDDRVVAIGCGQHRSRQTVGTQHSERRVHDRSRRAQDEAAGEHRFLDSRLLEGEPPSHIRNDTAECFACGMCAPPVHVRGDRQDPVLPLELPERLEEGDGVLTPLAHCCVMSTHQVLEQQHRVVRVTDLTRLTRLTEVTEVTEVTVCTFRPAAALHPVDDLPLETVHLLHARGDLQHEAAGEGAAVRRLSGARGGMR